MLKIRLALCFLTCGTSILAGCGSGGGGGSQNPPPPAITVSVSPATASLNQGATQTFTATVANDSSNAGVTWSIGSGAGTRSATTTTSVTYTAPAPIAASATVTLTATSKASPGTSASAAITLVPPPPPTITSVAAACVPASIQTSATSQCTATVAGTGSFSTAVTWSVGGVAGGNSTLGTISSAGLYTAPSAVPAANPVSITATSTEDTTKSGSASVTVTAATPTITSVAAACAPASIQTGATSQCAATVTGTGSYSSAVTWTVGGVAGGNSTLGTISSAGLYTAPSAVPATNPVTITATSTANTAKSGSAAITVTAPPTITSVTTACVPASVQTGATSQCTATVAGTGSFSSAVTWSVGGVAGGNSTLGTISSAGLYTAPSAVPTTNPVTITATSTANTAKSGSASITVTAAPTITSVAAACVPTSVQTSATSQCTATVAGTGSFSTAVTWAVGGVAGGNSTLGTISSAGLYTAPSAVPATNPVTITATSTANTAKSGTASITVTASTATITSVAASCLSGSVQTGTTSQCTATVTGTGSYSSAVTWAVGGVAGGNSSLGTISTSGLYTAPAAVPATNPVTITATSTANTAKSGSYTITITAAPATITSVSAACVPTSVQTSATSQCTATVTGTGSYSSAVTWSAGGVAGGNSTVGTISSAGLYTAPSTIPATNPVTITATSTANTTKSGSATITITAATSGSITITALSETSANPFDLLTITGTGFINATAAISVMFIPENGDPVVTFPVSLMPSDPGTVQVMVPPLTNSAGNLSAEIVDIQVVAYSTTTTYASNTITGLPVGALPSVSAPTGAVTAALLIASANMTSTLQAAVSGNSTFSNISTPLTQFSTDLAPLTNAIETLVADPTQSPITLATADGQTVPLSMQQLAESDQLAKAIVAAIVNQGEIPAATSTTGCPAATGDSTFDSNLCSLQQYFQALAEQAQTPAFRQRRAQEMDKAHPELTKVEAAVASVYINLSLGVIAEACEPAGGYLVYELVVAPVVTSAISLFVTDQFPTTADAAAVDYLKAYGLTVIDGAFFAGAPVIFTTVDILEVGIAAYEDTEPEVPTPNGQLSYYGPAKPSSLGYYDQVGNLVVENIQPPTPKMPPDSLTLVLAPTSAPYTLSVTTSGSGTFDQFPTGTSFPALAVVGLKAIPLGASTFTGWGGACSGTGICSVTMDANESVTATFQPSVSGGSLTGTWTGPWTELLVGGDFCTSEAFTLTWNLTQTGASVAGTYAYVVTATNGFCPDNVGDQQTGNLVQGTVSGATLAISMDSGTAFSGTFTSTTITGTGGDTSQSDGPFTLTKK